MRAPQRKPGLGALALLSAGLWLLLGAGGESPRRQAARSVNVMASVVRVIDGDTARMRVAGRVESVRYIGIDTPESAIPGEAPECFGRRAAALNRRLVGGRVVRLWFGHERRDDYGRLLAYVYAGGAFVNARLVASGRARRLAIAPNDEHAGRLARLEQRAANTGRGLWGACSGDS